MTQEPLAGAAGLDRGALEYRARTGDRAAQDELRNRRRTKSEPQTPAPDPATPDPEVDTDQLRRQIAAAAGLDDDDLVLLTGTTREELTAQADRVKGIGLPAFAPNPAQAAGTGTPRQGGVEAGRELYRTQSSARPDWLD